MISFLIKALGGITLEEYNKAQDSLIRSFHNQLNSVHDANQMMLSAKIAEIATLKDQIKDYRDDRAFYQEKLFPEQPKVQDDLNRKLEPINTTRIPWTRRKHMLEQADLKKVREEAKSQADSIEARVRAKNSKVSEQESAS